MKFILSLLLPTAALGIVTGCNSADFVAEIKESEGSVLAPEPKTIDQIATKLWRFPIELHNVSGETINYEENAVETPITMQYSTSSLSKPFIQTDRRREESFTQRATRQTVSGSHEYPQTATTSMRPLDILLVVDNSGSMSTERNGLGERLSNLLMHVENSDWKIAITSTDVNHYLKEDWVLKKQTPLPTGRFKTIVDNEIANRRNDSERPILMAVNALGRDEGSYEPGGRKSADGNQLNDWFRSASSIAVILVTDEDNSEKGANVDINTSVLVNHLQQTMGRIARETYQIHGILSYSHKASYEPIINASGGSIGRVDKITTGNNVDGAEYNRVINSIANGIYEVLANKLDLRNLSSSKENFNLTGVLVKVGNGSWARKTAGVDYDYDSAEKTIVFKPGKVPTKYSTIKVEYTYTSQALTKKFTLTNGVPLSTETPSISSTSNCSSWTNRAFKVSGNVVTFSQAPPDGCQFTLRYKKNEQLKEHVFLSLPEPSKNEIFAVTVNGNDAFSNFNANNGYLTLNPIPSDGKVINIAYKYRTKILKYQINISPGLTSRDEIVCVNAADKQVKCSVEGNRIVFTEGSFSSSSKIIVRQPLASTSEISFLSLSEGYETNTVFLSLVDSNGESSTCSGAINELDIQNAEIKLTTDKARQICPALAKNNLKTLTLLPYKYRKKPEFKIVDGEFFSYHQHKSEVWKVSVDNDKLEEDEYDLDKEEHIITLKRQPPVGAEVKITVTLVLE